MQNLKSTLLCCAISTWLLVSSPMAFAQLVTIDFEGPVNGGFYENPADPSERFLTGQVTYMTDVQGTDGRGPFDRGDSNVFYDAIVSFSFTTPDISRSFGAGAIRNYVQLYNDYIVCGRNRCRPPELDTLFFVQIFDAEDLQLIIKGMDQSLLASGNLPKSFSIADVGRVDLFWSSSIGELVGNSMRISSVSVPEPATLGMLGAGLLALGVMRRKRAA